MKRLLILCTMASVLSGCAGVNSEFEFDKPAKDSGIWMSQADDMSATAVRSAPASGGISLDQYRLMDTGDIRLDVQPDVETLPGLVDDSRIAPGTASSGVRPFTQVNDRRYASIDRTATCNALHCWPEPASAFRKPDGVERIWIAPYVSPDNNAHMGEVIYTVSGPSDWNGIVM
ncbi:TraV family lipoprotein [Pantoea sp. BAV 3049]|uniref:TraV family lipoprotein n=1 Tax=Pantoea sp. BAV 3049 TaxID=2654188 RepID=UPI00131DC4A4|nr:TraV family lipoprotein [Pantoea sp. BAV 3049]